MNKNNSNYTSFLLIIIALVWVGSFIVVDATVKQIQPITIAFLRFWIATPFMIISIFIFKKNQLIKLRDLHDFSKTVLIDVGIKFYHLKWDKTFLTVSNWRVWMYYKMFSFGFIVNLITSVKKIFISDTFVTKSEWIR